MKREQYGSQSHIGVDPGDPTEPDLVKMATERLVDTMYRDIGREATKRKAVAVYIEAPKIGVLDDRASGDPLITLPGRTVMVKTGVEFYDEGDMRPLNRAIRLPDYLDASPPKSAADIGVPVTAPPSDEDVAAAKALGVDPNAPPEMTSVSIPGWDGSEVQAMRKKLAKMLTEIGSRDTP